MALIAAHLNAEVILGGEGVAIGYIISLPPPPSVPPTTLPPPFSPVTILLVR